MAALGQRYIHSLSSDYFADRVSLTRHSSVRPGRFSCCRAATCNLLGKYTAAFPFRGLVTITRTVGKNNLFTQALEQVENSW